MKIKYFLNDTFKTLLSNILILGVVQFILFPFFSYNYNNIEFGEIITLYSIITIFSTVIGNTLNNVRLIYLKNFKKNSINSFFLKLLFLSVLVITVLLTILLKYYFHIELTELIFLILIQIFMTFRVYLLVFFRIELDYTNLLKNSFFYGIGILLGIIIFYYCKDLWIIPLFIGEIFSTFFIFIFIRSKNYDIEKINFIDNISKHYLQLLLINFFNTLINYFDRFLIFSLLGGYYVTIVFITTFASKFISSFTSPLSSVLLSYLPKSDEKNIKEILKLTNIISSFILVGFLLIIYPTSYIVCTIFYNEKFNLIRDYIIIGNLGIILNILGNLYFPLNIMYTPPKSQSKVQIVYFIVYFSFTLILTYSLGLFGFFIGSIISNAIRLFLMVKLTYQHVGGKNNENYITSNRYF